MVSNKFLYIKYISILLLIVAIDKSAFANSNICKSAEDNPSTKYLLNSPPNNIEGAVPYVYKSINGIDLRMHVFSPTNKSYAFESKKTAIVFFYGGAWEYGTVNDLIEPAKYFSSRGAISILVDYRVFCRNGNSIAEEISDAKSAVRYIRMHANQLGIDPNRIVVSGASAGGHLALSTATIDDFEPTDEDLSISSKPNLLTLFYPCSDATTDDEKIYGGDAIGTYGQEVSPLYHIHKNLPAMLVIQGTEDIVYKENKMLCAESAALGNICKFMVYKGASHGFFGSEFENGKWYKKALKETDSFLTKAGYLSHI